MQTLSIRHDSLDCCHTKVSSPMLQTIAEQIAELHWGKILFEVFENVVLKRIRAMLIPRGLHCFVVMHSAAFWHRDYPKNSS